MLGRSGDGKTEIADRSISSHEGEHAEVVASTEVREDDMPIRHAFLDKMFCRLMRTMGMEFLGRISAMLMFSFDGSFE